MAHMNQTKKATIAAALKAVTPAGWKLSLAVRNHSTIVCTITAAPFDLIAAMKPSPYLDPADGRADINVYHYRDHVEDECVADVFGAMLDALNTGNHDNSDSMTDHFDVGHYVTLRIGCFGKPFVCTARPLAFA